MKKDTNQHNFFVKLLWFLSGVNVDVLKVCQVDQGKYAAIGFTILMTAILASLSGGYALWTVFNSLKIAIAFGSFWGLLIGNLDRFLVTTIKKEDKLSVQQLFIVAIRVTGAIAIAFVIAKPLELRIYEKPIRAELTEQNSIVAGKNQDRLNLKYGEIGQLEQKNQTLKEELKHWEDEKESAYNAVIGEAEGTNGTKKVGQGPVYDKKWQKYQESTNDYQSHQRDLDSQIRDNQQRITDLTKQRDLELKAIVVDKEKADDIMTFLEILDNLGQKKPTYLWSSRAIELLFILIDVTPILAKILSPRSAYDIMLNEQEETQIKLAQKSLEEEEEALTKIAIELFKQVGETHLEAISKIKQNPKYSELLNEIVDFYMHKIRKDVSQLVKEIDFSSYKENIKKAIEKIVKNIIVPKTVEEEVRKEQTKAEADATVDASSVALNGHLKNIRND